METTCSQLDAICDSCLFFSTCNIKIKILKIIIMIYLGIYIKIFTLNDVQVFE